MRFKDVFSIIGPSMVGPSSSHTAGAVRLGRTARQVLGGVPEKAEITLYGSFADTYRGHGTDLALIGGLLNFGTDDMRIKAAYACAEAAGMEVIFKTAQKPGVHPNTASMKLSLEGREAIVTGCSIGGGNIEIIGVNGFDVKFTAIYPTLLIFHDDRAGIIADMTEILKLANLNIGYMEVDRKSRSGDAVTVIESDETLPQPYVQRIAALSNVHSICVVDLRDEEGIS